MQSEHRTLNWEEADFFYMPLYVNLLVWPVFGWADGPWWGGVWGAAPAPPRAAQQTVDVRSCMLVTVAGAV